VLPQECLQAVKFLVPSNFYAGKVFLPATGKFEFSKSVGIVYRNSVLASRGGAAPPQS
jgi:hypothetical protein